MFKELGSLMSLMGNRAKIQEEVQKFQARVGTITAEATAGAGYVTAKANGKLEVLSVKISDEAMALNDREMLEELRRKGMDDRQSEQNCCEHIEVDVHGISA